MDRVANGDAEAVFALSAATELENRRADRWSKLFKQLKNIFS